MSSEKLPTIPGLGFTPKRDPEKEICFATFDQNKTILLENQEKVGKCRLVSDFEKLEKLGCGSFGIVYKARDTKSGEIVAMKKLMMDKEKEGLSISYLREISILQKLKHQNIVNLKEVVVGKTLESIFLVMEYCEQDLHTVIENRDARIPENQVKCIMTQLLSGLSYLHRNHVMHRDLTVANLLLNAKGCLKIADFGQAKRYGTPDQVMSPSVCTLWYRAPEVLLAASTYSIAIDMWAVGCIFGELLLNRVLFEGRSEIHQMELIFNILGTPDDQVWPGFSTLGLSKQYSFPLKSAKKLDEMFNALVPQGNELLNALLTYDPSKRITTSTALRSPYFQQIPRACSPQHLASLITLTKLSGTKQDVPGLEPALS